MKIKLTILLSMLLLLAGCDYSDVDYTPESYDFSSKVTTNEFLAEGTYLVGTDVKAGDYILLGEEGYYEICLTTDCVIENDELLYNDLFGSRGYITLEDGQYLTFDRSQMFKLEYYKHELETSVDYAAFFLVGEDLAAGTYTLGGEGWYNLCTEPTCDFLKGEEVSSHIFEEDQTVDVTVLDGQYLYIYNKVTSK